jgi:hypothetical protein
MSWKQLLAARKVHMHKTSKQELDDLRAVIRRGLSDAAIPALSEDRRFATAYNAALQTAKIAVACAGYRVGAIPGHHAISFECAGIALGKQADALVGFLTSAVGSATSSTTLGYKLPHRPRLPRFFREHKSSVLLWRHGSNQRIPA